MDWSKHDSKNIKDAHPALQKAWPQILKKYELKQPGYTLWLTCTHRTPEAQLELYKKGRHNVGTMQNPQWEVTEPKEIVTYCDGITKHSKHSLYPAEAIDVVAVDNVAKRLWWAESYYYPLGAICRDLGLEWGGSWSVFKDYPHIQIGKDRASSKNSSGFWQNETTKDISFD